jgi:hypothetical protein
LLERKTDKTVSESKIDAAAKELKKVKFKTF